MDTTSDISGTGTGTAGNLLDRWTLVGKASDFKTGAGPGAIPCFGIPTSKFNTSAGCTSVAVPPGATTPAAQVANMPAACVAAASAEPNGLLDSLVPMNAQIPYLPAGNLNTATTGLQSLANFGCYMENGSVIVPPAQGTFGTMGRYALRTPGLHECDLSLGKAWKFRERYSAKFRAEAFNVLNQTQYAVAKANPASPSSFGQSQATPTRVATLCSGPAGPAQSSWAWS